MVEMTDDKSNESQSKKRNWTFPAVVLLAVGALTAVALLREPVTLDPGTPERTVQTYLQALAEEDFETALSLTTPEIQQS
jgi:hypothetical protein